MFFKFCVTRSKKTKFSSLSQRLGACFYSRVLRFATIAAAFLPAIASATPILPAPIFHASLSKLGVNHVFEAAGTYALGGALITLTGRPGALISAHTVGGTREISAEDGHIRFAYAVDGPLDGVLVPLFFTFTLQGDAFSGGTRSTVMGAFAEADIHGGTISIAKRVTAVLDAPRFVFTATLPFNQFSGVVDFVDMSVIAGSDSTGDPCVGCTPVADAFVDPFIFIDPVFLASNPGYSVIVSEGIGNAAPAAPGVPEPATLALFASGLMGFVALRRRRT